MVDSETINEVQKVTHQLQDLVDAVKMLSDIQSNRCYQEDPQTFYSVETTDEGEMRRFMKASDALMALQEIVTGNWQRSMIHHGGADALTDIDGKTICPSEAMAKYREHIFEVLGQHGIVLDDML